MKNNIKAYRLELGLTQDELAKISGVSRTIISQLENNSRKNITYGSMLKIAKALKKNVEQIFLM